MPSSKNLQECSGVLRFHVSTGRDQVVAFISDATCLASGASSYSAVSLADFYRQHALAIDEIVLGKLRAGARRPVVVMARDLRRQLLVGEVVSGLVGLPS